MFKYFLRTIKDEELQTLDEFKTGAWIYIENPSAEEIDELAASRGLDASLLRDALDPNEVPRVENENGVTYIYTRMAVQEGSEVRTVPLLVGVAESFVFTVSIRPLLFIERFQSGKVPIYTTQKAKLLTQIFGEVIMYYNRVLTDISRRVRSLGVRLERIDNRDIIQLVIFEQELNDFLAALIPTHALLQNILSGRFFKLYDRDHDLIEDLFHASGQLVEMCKSNLRSTVNVRDAYSTIMTNNLNRVIKVLTALTVVLAVPTMIASFFGMNVPVPGTDSSNAFLVIILISIFLSAITFGAFFRSRWL